MDWKSENRKKALQKYKNGNKFQIFFGLRTRILAVNNVFS